MPTRKVTVATLAGLKARSEKAVFVTAYDYPTATFADRAGVDMILVGDSAAMTMLGLPSTLQIGLNEMLVFIGAVTRAFCDEELPEIGIPRSCTIWKRICAALK